MQKKAMILNISHNELRQILALKELGFYVVATGNKPGLIGGKYVDKYIPADYSDKEKILELAKSLKIDAICACCNDFGVITAAYVAEKMELSGHDTYENALIIHHKDRFKQFAKMYGINTPQAECFSEQNDAINWLNETRYPIIVKPTDLTGGKGVSKANTYKEAVEAIKTAFLLSKSKRIVIEHFIEGTQHACCTFIMKQKVVAYCTNNEYSYVNPYLVEIDTYPADNFESIKPIILNETEKISSILGLKDGILHIQYRMKNGKPYIIEIMRRVLGNLYMIPAEKHTGINWDYWEARSHCGLDCSDFPSSFERKGFYAYKTIMGQKNGKIKKLIIPEAFKKYIFDEYILWSQDKQIENHKSEQLGFLFFQFDSKEEMNEILFDRYNEIFLEYYMDDEK
jgi:carbamoylphosphate synthase large subunit